jgi:predicted dithiol-disulfide oxidoreductase (DUF899 family)
MPEHLTGTREEWLAARLELLEAEKELTRRGDELARRRQALPWVPVEKDYAFETTDGKASFADLFRDRSQLLIYHFMFGPEYAAGCPACSAIADGFSRSAVHLENHDVGLIAVSRAPIDAIEGYRRRMGWEFPWASSLGSDFNYDYSASLTEEQQREQGVPEGAGVAMMAGFVGTDVATYVREQPGMSAFALEDGAVYHTYSAYARGCDALWGMYQWLDRAPRGRNEASAPGDPLGWFRRHDEYAGD